MCGIFGVFNYNGDVSAYRQRALYLSKKYVISEPFLSLCFLVVYHLLILTPVLSCRIRHRGPDWSGCVIKGNHIMAHERLAIVGVGKSPFKMGMRVIDKHFFLTLSSTLDSGAQPLTNEDDSIILCVNGEIYNHRHLRAQLKEEHTFKTHSDCEVIMHLVS